METSTNYPTELDLHSENLSQLNYAKFSESAMDNGFVVAEPESEYDIQAQHWAKIIVNCPIKLKQESDLASERNPVKLYTYRVPFNLTVEVGDVVIVPLQSQVVGGIVVSMSNNIPTELIEELRKEGKSVQDIDIKDIEKVTQRKFYLLPTLIYLKK